MKYITTQYAQTLAEPTGDDPLHHGSRITTFDADSDEHASEVAERIAREYARQIEHEHEGRSAVIYTFGPLFERIA